MRIMMMFFLFGLWVCVRGKGIRSLSREMDGVFSPPPSFCPSSGSRCRAQISSTFRAARCDETWEPKEQTIGFLFTAHCEKKNTVKTARHVFSEPKMTPSNLLLQSETQRLFIYEHGRQIKAETMNCCPSALFRSTHQCSTKITTLEISNLVSAPRCVDQTEILKSSCTQCPPEICSDTFISLETNRLNSQETQASC